MAKLSSVYAKRKTAKDREPPIEIPMNGGVLLFYPASHRYKWNGEWFTSVSAILGNLGKFGLDKWAAGCAVDHIEAVSKWHPNGYYHVRKDHLADARTAYQRVKQDAADTGTLLHDYAHETMKSLMGEKARHVWIDPETPAARAAAAFDEWRSNHVIKPEQLECRVVNIAQKYAGTTDLKGTIDGRRAIVDYKTGNGVYREAFLQLRGYDDAMSVMGWPQGYDHWVIHLNKNTGEFQAYCLRAGSDDQRLLTKAWHLLVHLHHVLKASPSMKELAFDRAAGYAGPGHASNTKPARLDR